MLYMRDGTYDGNWDNNYWGDTLLPTYCLGVGAPLRPWNSHWVYATNSLFGPITTQTFYDQNAIPCEVDYIQVVGVSQVAFDPSLTSSTVSVATDENAPRRLALGLFGWAVVIYESARLRCRHLGLPMSNFPPTPWLVSPVISDLMSLTRTS